MKLIAQAQDVPDDGQGDGSMDRTTLLPDIGSMTFAQQIMARADVETTQEVPRFILNYLIAQARPSLVAVVPTVRERAVPTEPKVIVSDIDDGTRL